MSDGVGRCHDCTAPQTEVNMLSRHILELQKDKGNLIDKIRELGQENERIKNSDTLCKLIGEQKRKISELEQKIEEMKCCGMCKYYSMSFLPYYCTKNNTAPHCTSKCDKWEIKENG